MEKAEKGIAVKAEDEKESVPQRVAALIREASKTGRLISESEILREASGENPVSPNTPDPTAAIETILEILINENKDLHALTAPDGSRDYYSSEFMTEAYARILNLKRGGPRQLIAEIVRQNSAFYPRPVPIDTFTQSPFSLTAQEVLREIEQMRGEEAYLDIASTTTSSPRVFLYSTLHLEADHAAMLAEWLDVGQFENP